MDQQLIKALIDALEASNLSELEYSADGETLRLAKRPAGATLAGTGPIQPTPPHDPAPPTRPRPAAPGATVPHAATDSTPHIVAAPLFGVVHLQRTPGAPPLVAVGQAVSAEQVLCVIEAMKVFTELRAGRDGIVAAVLVESGQEVEAGQPLFRLG